MSVDIIAWFKDLWYSSFLLIFLWSCLWSIFLGSSAYHGSFCSCLNFGSLFRCSRGALISSHLRLATLRVIAVDVWCNWYNRDRRDIYLMSNLVVVKEEWQFAKKRLHFQLCVFKGKKYSCYAPSLMDVILYIRRHPFLTTQKSSPV